MIDKRKIAENKAYREGVKDTLLQVINAKTEDEVRETSMLIIAQIKEIDSMEKKNQDEIKRYIDEQGTPVTC
jgi:hypothetical protein